MPASVMFDDNFESDPLGQGPPTALTGTWHSFNNGFPAVEALSTFGNTTRGYHNAVSTYAYVNNSTVSAMTLFYELCPDINANFGVITIGQLDPLNLGVQSAYLNLVFEPDHTISLRDPNNNNLFANSGFAPMSLTEWSYLQLNCSVSSSGSFVGVDATVAVAGTVVAQTAGLVPTIILKGGTPLSPDFKPNFIEFQGQRFIDNITAYGSATITTGTGTINPSGTGTADLTGWPHPNNPLARWSQASVEWLKQPSNSAARLSQGVLEWMKLPSNEAVRMSQGVVEVVINRGASAWQVYEA